MPSSGESRAGRVRGEVLGLRWSDIDLKAKILTVSQARVLVDYTVRIGLGPTAVSVTAEQGKRSPSRH